VAILLYLLLFPPNRTQKAHVNGMKNSAKRNPNRATAITISPALQQTRRLFGCSGNSCSAESTRRQWRQQNNRFLFRGCVVYLDAQSK